MFMASTYLDVTIELDPGKDGKGHAETDGILEGGQSGHGLPSQRSVTIDDVGETGARDGNQDAPHHT